MKTRWVWLAAALCMGLTAAFAQATPETPAAPPWAGSYDGEFYLEGGQARAGTWTAALRQDGDQLSGWIGQEYDDGGCIRASEFTAALDQDFFEATARALDGSAVETSLLAGFVEVEGQRYMYGYGTARGCGAATLPFLFLTRRLEPGCPPAGPFLYTGGLWNVEGSPGQQRSTIERIQGQIQGRNFTVTTIRVSTVIGPITGTAQGKINEACDRVQSLVITLDTLVGPLTLRGELGITSDGSVIFGALRTGPLDPIALAGSLLARRQ